MAQREGLASTLDSLAPDQEQLPENSPAEQMSLLPLPAKMPDDDLAPVERRGAGRPPGATNKRTKAWSDYLLQRYRSPLVVLAETYSRPVKELAEALGCDQAEAFKMQAAAAVALAPYIHQKMPMAIKIDDRKALYLVLPDPDAAAGAVAEIDGELRIGVQPESEPWDNES